MRRAKKPHFRIGGIDGEYFRNIVEDSEIHRGISYNSEGRVVAYARNLERDKGGEIAFRGELDDFVVCRVLESDKALLSLEHLGKNLGLRNIPEQLDPSSYKGLYIIDERLQTLEGLGIGDEVVEHNMITSSVKLGKFFEDSLNFDSERTVRDEEDIMRSLGREFIGSYSSGSFEEMYKDVRERTRY